MKKKVLIILHHLPVIIYFLTVIAVSYSVVQSGFFHRFDIDEMINAQKAYLISNGSKPFLSYFSIYSPIIHWILLPVFTVTGFTFESLTAARLLMIVIFGLRIFFIFYLSWKIFNKWVAYLFILLFLLDPFTVFCAMQIRPDNFGLLFLSIALLLLAIGIFNSSKKLLFTAGFFLSLAVITSIKVMPSVAVTSGVFFLYSIIKRDKNFLLFFAGALVPAFAFFGYFFFQGSLSQMVQQLFIDSVKIINDNHSLAPLGFFYQPDNANLYGYYGKPPAWFYEWILPLTGFIGLYETLIAVATKKFEKKDLIKIILLLSFVLQWLALFFTGSVYLQYFLPTSWFYALFSAVAFFHLYSVIKNPFIKYGLTAFFSLCLLGLSLSSLKGNLLRADGAGFWMTRLLLDRQEKEIPPDALVFPNILFHPLVNEFVLGYPLERLPEEVVARFTSVPEALEKKKVPYLFYSMNDNIFMRPEWMPYVAAHYEPSSIDAALWIRKGE